MYRVIVMICVMGLSVACVSEQVSNEKVVSVVRDVQSFDRYIEGIKELDAPCDVLFDLVKTFELIDWNVYYGSVIKDSSLDYSFLDTEDINREYRSKIREVCRDSTSFYLDSYPGGTLQYHIDDGGEDASYLIYDGQYGGWIIQSGPNDENDITDDNN